MTNSAAYVIGVKSVHGGLSRAIDLAVLAGAITLLQATAIIAPYMGSPARRVPETFQAGALSFCCRSGS